IHLGTAEVVGAIQAHARQNSRLIGYRTYLRGKGIRGKSWQVSANVSGGIAAFGGRVASAARAHGQSAADTGADWVAGSPALATAIIAAGYGLGRRTSLALDASALEMQKQIVRQGDRILIKGEKRIFSAAQNAAATYRAGATLAEETSTSLARAGRGLRGRSSAAGDKIASSGAAIAASGPVKGRLIQRSATRTAARVGGAMASLGEQLTKDSLKSGEKFSRAGTRRGKATIAGSLAHAGASLKKGGAKAGAAFKKSGGYIIGYSALPHKIAGHFDEVSPSKSLGGFIKGFEQRGRWRARNSERFLAITKDTTSGYSGGVKLKIARAGKVFDEGFDEVGPGLAALKALRWIVEGIVWDGVIKPAGKLTGGALGYLSVNGIAYPALVTYDGLKSTASFAVQVTKGTVYSGYEVVAPTGQAALAALMGIGNAAVAVGSAAAVGGGGTLVGAVDLALSKMGGLAVTYGGAAAGATVRYVAVPVAQAGVHMGGAVLGVVSAGGTMAIGGGMMAAGQAVKAAGVITGFAMEYGLAPATEAMATAGGAVAAGGRFFFDEATGIIFYATGGVAKGAAHTVETVIKYGVAPATTGVVTVVGTATGTASGVGAAIGGSAVYLWGKTVHASGYVAGKTIQHGLAPVTKVGIVGVGVTSGASVQGAGKVGQAATFVVGKALAGTTWVFGNALAAGTLVGGTAASAAYGTAVGLYEMASAIVVPVGHIGGAGIVLSYKSITHLAAHSVLAVSDASYLVLSLEGPRWVVYAVKGTLGDGSDLMPGTVLNLKKMQESGEAFYNVPVSQREMTGVVGTVVVEMPTVAEKPASDATP
ncbi:MAG: hypothetical protein V3S29_13960, partial [bacterium]